MINPSKFLVVDNNANNSGLSVRTLSRKFPSAAVQLCAKTETALTIAGCELFAAIVIHRTFDDDASILTVQMRESQPAEVIIVISGVDRSEAVFQEGADGFLNFDEWLRLGTVVANALEARDNAGKK